MGVRLIVEILDHWQDFGLTSGERGDLIVIAEQTSDKTRETVVSIHRPYVLRRAGKESAASWRNAIGKLMKKKVLEHAVVDGRKIMGHEGQAARYRIPFLCPLKIHDGLYGQCERPESVTSEMTLFPEAAIQEGHPSDDALTQEGHLTGARGSSERCAEGHLTGDPSPSYPSSPSKPPRKRAAAKKPAEVKPNPHQVADGLVAGFWERYGDAKLQEFIAVRQIIRKAVAKGIDRDVLAFALDKVGEGGKPVSNGTLEFAMGQRRQEQAKRQQGGARSETPSHGQPKKGINL